MSTTASSAIAWRTATSSTMLGGRLRQSGADGRQLTPDVGRSNLALWVAWHRRNGGDVAHVAGRPPAVSPTDATNQTLLVQSTDEDYSELPRDRR